MIKKHEFIERLLYMIHKSLSENLPEEDTLEEMIEQTKRFIEEL